MKYYGFILLIPIVALLTIVVGCKNDVAEPIWAQPGSATLTISVDSIIPAQIPVGVNTVTILGKNFDPDIRKNFVYFGDTIAAIKSLSNSQIVVYRPNIVIDSCRVRVTSNTSYNISNAYGPCRVDSVFGKYGILTDTFRLGAIAVDNTENVYGVRLNNGLYNIWRIPENSSPVLLGNATYQPSDFKIHNGILYIIGTGTSGNRNIYQMNLTSGVVSKWTTMPTNRFAFYGDFGPTGYFYTGGTYKTTFSDLCIVPPNPPSTLNATQVKYAKAYTSDSIFAIRVYNGYVYVASKPIAATATKIFKHQINADSVMQQIPVLDLGDYGITSAVKGLAFSSNGTMYIMIDDVNSLLVFDGITLDYFYKGIVPGNAKQCYWGTSTFLYTINAINSGKWNIERINIGATRAPYY